MYSYKEHIEIRYYETDKMGIVHHSNYPRFFELTRLHFLDSIGINFFEFEKIGLVSPVLTMNTEFIRPAIFGDVITVEAKISSFNGVRVFFEYVVTNQKGELLTKGLSSHTFTTADLKPVRLKRDYPDYYNKLYKASIEE